MSRASLFILLILGTVGSQAKIVHQVAPNQFEFELEERGTRLTQKIRFDPDGLRITEVPAHNELVHAIYVFDSSTGLQMNVINSTKSCQLHFPIFTMNNEDEKTNLEGASHNDDEESEFLKINHEDTMTMEIITVMGPELDRTEIPAQLAKHCPGNFQFLAIKQVQANSPNVHPQENGDTLIGDPRLQKDVEYGDIADFSDLFQVLPNQRRRSSRVRRNACVVDGVTVPSCHIVGVTCENGCHSDDVFYNCIDSGSGRSCEYFLNCKKVMPGLKCVMHFTAAMRRCDPCCRIANCGRRMPQCLPGPGVTPT